VLEQAIGSMREYVKTSLPFKRGERLAVLDEIQTQFNSGRLTPPRLHIAYEPEIVLRMARTILNWANTHWDDYCISKSGHP
jgi:hypothetical protein